jgi:hypothetical protein
MSCAASEPSTDLLLLGNEKGFFMHWFIYMCFSLELSNMLLGSVAFYRPSIIMSSSWHSLQQFASNYFPTDTQFPNLVIVDGGFRSLLFCFENREKLPEDIQAIS